MSRIYIIDDHAIVRDGLRALLATAGHDVVGESSQPAHAIGELARLEPDVLLLDLSLGERSGLELLEQLHRRDRSPRTIVLTMSAQPRHVAESLRLGASGYVLKGSPSAELLGAIDSVMQGRRVLGDGVADLALETLADDAQGQSIGGLSPRERQIVLMVVNGKSSAAIGAELHLSPKTIDTYRSRIMAKVGVGDLPALVRWAIRAGLIDADAP